MILFKLLLIYTIIVIKYIYCSVLNKEKNNTIIFNENLTNNSIKNKLLNRKNIPYENKNEYYQFKNSLIINSRYTTSFSFYNQLDGEEKRIYDTIYEGSIKTLPVFDYEFDVNFDNLDEFRKTRLKILTIMYLENPELWWIRGGTKCYYKNYYNNVIYHFNITIKDYDDSLYKNYSAEQISKLNEEIIDEKKKIIKKIKTLNIKTPYAVMRFIHDYLIKNINYLFDNNKIFNHDIYGALVEMECSYIGFSKAFQYLSNQFGINCIMALGYENNARWNFVELHNKWYIVDVSRDIGNEKDILLDFFLIGSKNEKYLNDKRYKLRYSFYDNYNEFITYPENIETNDYIPNEEEIKENNTFLSTPFVLIKSTFKYF